MANRGWGAQVAPPAPFPLRGGGSRIRYQRCEDRRLVSAGKGFRPAATPGGPRFQITKPPRGCAGALALVRLSPAAYLRAVWVATISVSSKRTRVSVPAFTTARFVS